MVTDHSALKRSGGVAQPGVLYMDGVPTTNTDGVLGIWVYFKLSLERHLVAAVKKSCLCKCGCRHWCSLLVISSWLHWSMGLMATGTNATSDWLGGPLTCPIRIALATEPLLYCFALVAIKGDWAEYCSTFAFANWKTARAPCLSCWSTTSNLLDDREFGNGSSPWPDFTMEDYLEACRMCEIIVTVASMTVLKRLRQSLHYDRRSNKGAHGRALRWPVPSLDLRLDSWGSVRAHPHSP